MDIISFETAERLKAAGLKIPKLSVGQVWYNQSRYPSVIIKNMGDEFSTGETHWQGFSIENGELGNDVPESIVRDMCYFAPTATDILKELGPNWNLSSFKTTSGQAQFAVIWNYECEEVADPDKEFYHENPAEACAAAWLQLNENKN